MLAIHLEKNCDEVSCAECGSNMHVTALHPGPALKANSSVDDAPEDGGETAVSASCTKVCGKDISVAPLLKNMPCKGVPSHSL